MRFETAPKKEVWRGRGRPPRFVPPEVAQMADATYRTGKVGILTISSDEEAELEELTGYLNSYARAKGRRMRIQRDRDVVRFELVDVVKRRKVSA